MWMRIKMMIRMTNARLRNPVLAIEVYYENVLSNISVINVGKCQNSRQLWSESITCNADTVMATTIYNPRIGNFHRCVTPKIRTHIFVV